MKGYKKAKSYPRVDKEYGLKNSLDFQNVRSNIYSTRPDGLMVKMSSWLAFFLIGIFVGIAAFLIDVLVEYLVQWKW
jgi:hypothetical protein